PVVMAYPLPEDAPFRPYPHSRIFGDPEKMLFNEGAHAFNTGICSRDRVGDDLPCTVRANFGTVVIASLFGARAEQVEENPPWIRHGDGRDVDLEGILDCDPLDFSQGWCPRVVETYRFYQSVFADYPELKKTIRIVLPDMQGPLDNLELITGSGVFTDFYSRPDLVSKALRAVAHAQVGFARHLTPCMSDGPEGFAHQHATTIRGAVLLRDDTAILMSPEMYRDLVAPHDEYVLREFGGGGIHACGRMDRHTDAMLALPSVLCLDFGQPEMNEIDPVYRAAKAKRIALVRVKATEAELTSGRILSRFPTGVSLLYEAASVADAQRTMGRYIEASERRAGHAS
ncbi:MAG: hypothetical protein ABIG68_05815, partial [Acidobacteriota bacterium]